MPRDIKMSASSLSQFKDYLLTFPLARLSPSGRELTMRCPFCGDSTHNSSKCSFSINVDPDSDGFLRYQCFRASCMVKGVVNADFFEQIDYIKSDVIKDIETFMASRNIKIGGSYKARRKKELVNFINPASEIADTKLRYVNNRLGLNLTFEDIRQFKINFSLNDLLRVNEIRIPEDKVRYYDLLTDYGVSFISAYNDYVIVRDISKSQRIGKRYSNINIFNNYDNVTKCYCIPRRIDLLDPNPCVINITEGAFDILGVYHHLNIDREYNNQLFLAACGGGIVNTIKAYIRQYGLLNIKVNIFSDSDVSIEKYNELKSLKPFVQKFDVTIYYNERSKDFGVPASEISCIKTKL